jgi:RHS repeat-associated protein
MLVPNRHGSIEDYRYGFNGKEKDSEIKGEGNSYDFGARLLDSRLGRWFAPDPLERKFSGFSTYNFAINSPLLHVDTDGKEIFIPISNTPSTYKFTKYHRLSYRGGLNPTNPQIILRDLQKQTNDKLKFTEVRDRDKLIGYKIEIETEGTENKGKDYSVQTKRISKLIKNPKIISVAKQNDGFNSTIPLSDGHSLILYNENRVADGTDGGVGVTNEDGTKGRPPFLGLTHETIHGEIYMDTKLTPDGPFENDFSTDPDSGKKEKFTIDEKLARERENEVREQHNGEVHDGIEVKQRSKVKQFGKEVKNDN